MTLSYPDALDDTRTDAQLALDFFSIVHTPDAWPTIESEAVSFTEARRAVEDDIRNFGSVVESWLRIQSKGSN